MYVTTANKPGNCYMLQWQSSSDVAVDSSLAAANVAMSNVAVVDNDGSVHRNCYLLCTTTGMLTKGKRHAMMLTKQGKGG